MVDYELHTFKVINTLKEELLDKAEIIGALLESTAVSFCPVGKGGDGSVGGYLRGQMYHEVIEEGNKIIVRYGSHAFYAPYIEFGTVEHVEVPAGMEDFAMQFKGRGIITKGGIKAHPFLLPAFYASLPTIISILAGNLHND